MQAVATSWGSISIAGGAGVEGSTVSVDGRTFTGNSVMHVNGRWIVDGKDVTDDNGAGGGAAAVVGGAVPCEIADPVDLKDAVQQIKYVRLHDRAKLFTGKWLDHFLGASAEQFIGVLNECYLHDRANAVMDYVSSKPVVFDGWRSRDWVDLMQAVYLHDRLKVLQSICAMLPNANITDGAAEAVYLHDQRKAQDAVTRHQLQAERRASLRPSRPLPAAAPAPPPAPAADSKLVVKNPTGLKEAPKTSDADSQCLVCMENRKHVVCMHCGHIGVCMACVTGIKSNTCLVCRKPVAEWLVTA